MVREGGREGRPRKELGEIDFMEYRNMECSQNSRKFRIDGTYRRDRSLENREVTFRVIFCQVLTGFKV